MNEWGSLAKCLPSLTGNNPALLSISATIELGDGLVQNCLLYIFLTDES